MNATDCYDEAERILTQAGNYTGAQVTAAYAYWASIWIELGKVREQ